MLPSRPIELAVLRRSEGTFSRPEGGGPVSTQDETVARRFFEELCTGRKLTLASELLTQDHVYHDPQVTAEKGPEGMAQAVAVFQNGVDGHWDVQEIFSTGDRVAVRWIGRGTHNGDVMGIPPTGKTVEVQALSVLRMQDGKIAENWTVWDTLSFLRQLGVIPPAGATV
jgi:steroid delta-isomerase-like uncharacterized protein